MQQTVEHVGPIISDAADEPEACDNNSSHDLQLLRFDI
jgi:hypothetical protein